CVEGETLARRLEKGALPLEQVLKYGAQLADALDKAHRAGIVHRDLKPANIMLTATGAKLLDFGLAKPAAPLVSGATLTVAAAQTSPLTQQGMLGLSSWRWLLILEGIPAIVCGLVTYFVLPSQPGEAKFLTNDEKEWLRAELAREEQQKTAQ